MIISVPCHLCGSRIHWCHFPVLIVEIISVCRVFYILCLTWPLQPPLTGKQNEYWIPTNSELEKKKKIIKEFMNYPSELPTPISKLKRWFMEVILSVSVTGVSIWMWWLSLASWCEMIVTQLVVKHMCLCVNINMYINTVGGSGGSSQAGGWIGGGTELPIGFGRERKTSNSYQVPNVCCSCHLN